MNKNHIFKFVEYTIIFVFFFLFFLYVVTFLKSDLNYHAEFARGIITGSTPIPGNFLLYLLIDLFSFFSINKFSSELSLSFLLSLAILLKYIITKKSIAINNNFFKMLFSKQKPCFPRQTPLHDEIKPSMLKSYLSLLRLL